MFKTFQSSECAATLLTIRKSLKFVETESFAFAHVFGVSFNQQLETSTRAGYKRFH
jgi:hypothetical protein